MSKRKRQRHFPASPNTAAASTQVPSSDNQVMTSGNLTLHELFEQQTTTMLNRSDLSEDQKQEILVAMACPCCGAGAMSYTIKLKR